MKKVFVLAVLVSCLIAAMTLSAQTQARTGKILIAYFTMPETDGVDASTSASRLVVGGAISGHMEFVANIIQRTTGGDLFEIKTVRTYPVSAHRQLLDAAQAEKNENARPRLATRITSLQDYDTIFIGYPIWWYDLPMPLYSFLEEYNFAGKTIIPFTVHGGSQFSGTVEKIVQLQPQATVSNDGLAVSRNNLARSEPEITAWLRRLGLAR